MSELEGLSDDRFGALLRRLREQRGLSQSALARAVGVSASTVNMLEAGQRRPGRETALGLARALDLDPVETDDLLVAGTHLPTVYARLASDDLALVRSITTLLADERVPRSRREAFARLVQLALGLCRASDE